MEATLQCDTTKAISVRAVHSAQQTLLDAQQTLAMSSAQHAPRIPTSTDKITEQTS